jgi:uncharacterized protein (DUF1015 family)
MQEISKEFVLKNLKESKNNLKSTHARLCFPIINRIYKKMSIGIKFPSIKVDKDLIIDGHHRYVASLLSGTKLDTIHYNKTSATVVIDWDVVILDTNDWDTEAKIKMLNEKDAEFNDIQIDKINELFK